MQAYLEEQEVVYHVPEPLLIQTGFQIDRSTLNVSIRIRENPDMIEVCAHLPIIFPIDLRLAAAETVVRANFGMILGRFDLDMAKGLLYFRNSIPVTETGVTEDQLGILLYSTVGTTNGYLRAFYRLLYGDQLSAAEVIAEVEMANDESDTGDESG